MALVTYGDISRAKAGWYAAELLKRAVPHLILQQFGQAKPLPKNSSDTIIFRRVNALSLATNPLTEGVTPSGSTPTVTEIQAVMQQYGDYVPITDRAYDMGQDGILNEYKDVLAEQAAQTVETVLFYILRAGTNVFYANGTTRVGLNSEYTLSMQRKMVRALKRQNVGLITSKVSSSPNFNTESVLPGYVAAVHVDMESTIRSMAGFIDVKDYGGGVTPYVSEIGAVEQVRYITSTLITSWADAGTSSTYNAAGYNTISTGSTYSDVYPILLFGKDAFFQTPLKGVSAMTPSMLAPGVPREGDPLGQRGYIGWKTYFTGGISNQLWMVRGECAVREL